MRGFFIQSLIGLLCLSALFVVQTKGADIRARLVDGDYLSDCRRTIADAPTGIDLRLYPVTPEARFEVLARARKHIGASPLVFLNLAMLYRQSNEFAAMNTCFDSTLMFFDIVTSDSANSGICQKDFFEAKIDSLRIACWRNLMARPVGSPLRDYLGLAVNVRSAEPHTIRLRNNLNRLFQVADRFRSLPEIFFSIGQVYRRLGVLDSMHIYFDSALIYCADGELYYSDRECCDRGRYEIVIDSLRANVIGDALDSQSHIDKVFLYDDFVHNLNGWPEGRFGGAAFGIGRGKYTVSMISPENIAVATLPVKTGQDFVIETVLRKSDGDKNSGFGLLWGGDSKGNYYIFAINGDGQFTVKKLKDKQWTDLIAWRPSPSINPGKAENKMRVKQVGEEFQFLVNDSPVGTIEAQKLFGDLVGFVDILDVTFAADYVLVYRPR